ncbi:MAG: RpiR family transcriptional regulator [Pseudomonadota bacterium]
MKMPINPSPSSGAGQRAEEHVALLFKANGWKVQREPVVGQYKADLLVKRGREAYLVEVKALSEGRPDRVIPLLSKAILQAQAYAREIGKARPLAVVYVRDASPSLFKQVREFSKHFAPDVSVGVISQSGAQRFWGEGLEGLSVEPSAVRKAPPKPSGLASHIFSDLNQWMLKVLLAPQIPERLLSAPRADYRNASELAGAANVSVMSAFRFLQQLREEGFLDESSPRFKLVRREELFRRWRAQALRPSPEMPMSFLIRRSAQLQLREFVSNHRGCLGLYAAAEALKLGHVKGVPPYVYVPRLLRLDQDAWKELMPANPGEPLDLILKQARAPQSVFRGAVHPDGLAVSDVLQVWLDVSAHPSRGEEQAELIYRKILKEVIGGGS